MSPRLPLSVFLALLLAAGPGWSQEPAQLRVLCYNIQHGRGMDGEVDLARIAGVAQRVEADVVALQEVDNRTQRTGGVDQAAELGRLLDMEHAFGRAIDYQGGQYGNAILSRWPIVERWTHPLPHTPGHEARCLLVARIEAEGIGPFVLGTTHMQHDRAEDRLAQAARINRILVKEAGTPIVLAGDVNARPGSEPVEMFLEHWEDSMADDPRPTAPADEPRVRIDYVFHRPADAWRVAKAKVLDEPVASDHRPLFVVFERVDPTSP